MAQKKEQEPNGNTHTEGMGHEHGHTHQRFNDLLNERKREREKERERKNLRDSYTFAFHHSKRIWSLDIDCILEM